MYEWILFWKLQMKRKLKLNRIERSTEFVIKKEKIVNKQVYSSFFLYKIFDKHMILEQLDHWSPWSNWTSNSKFSTKKKTF